jgi:hypothetical protein
MPRKSRNTRRRGGQDPRGEREEGEVVGPRLPPPAPSPPGLSNEPQPASYDPNAAPVSGQGRRKSRRGSRKSRRGGFTKGAIPYGKRCVFPDASMTTETRTFAPGELVCYRDPSDMATDKSATYLFNVTPVVHRIKQTIDDVEVYAPWQYVGKLVDAPPGLSNESSGAADWGNWANVQPGTQVTVAGPLLTRSSAAGIGQGRRSRKSRRITRRR